MASKVEISKILAILAASYPRFELKNETVAAYFEMLKDLSAVDLKAASLRCANEGDWFPSVHQIRKAVAENLRQANGVPSAYEAWEEVKQFPKDGFSSIVIEEGEQFTILKRRMHWSHPLVEKVAKQMGWPDFPISNEIGVDRAHFFKAYEYALSEAMRDQVQLPEVKAYIEINQAKLKQLDIPKEIQKL